jgi:hypothetical protein
MEMWRRSYRIALLAVGLGWFGPGEAAVACPKARPLACLEAGECARIAFEQIAPQPAADFYALRGGLNPPAHTYATMRSQDARLYSIVRPVSNLYGGLLPDDSYLGIGVMGRSLCSVSWSRGRSANHELYTPPAPPETKPAAVPAIPGATLVATDNFGAKDYIGLWHAGDESLLVYFRVAHDRAGRARARNVKVVGKSPIRWRFVAASTGMHGEPSFSLLSDARQGEWLHFAAYTIMPHLVYGMRRRECAKLRRMIGGASTACPGSDR